MSELAGQSDLDALKARALELAPQIASALGVSESEARERIPHAKNADALRVVVDAAEEVAGWESLMTELADG